MGPPFGRCGVSTWYGVVVLPEPPRPPKDLRVFSLENDVNAWCGGNRRRGDSRCEERVRIHCEETKVRVSRPGDQEGSKTHASSGYTTMPHR